MKCVYTFHYTCFKFDLFLLLILQFTFFKEIFPYFQDNHYSKGIWLQIRFLLFFFIYHLYVILLYRRESVVEASVDSMVGNRFISLLLVNKSESTNSKTNKIDRSLSFSLICFFLSFFVTIVCVPLHFIDL